MNFVQFLETSALRYPDKTAMVMKERRLTYRELEDRVRRLSGALSAMGYRPGDRIALAACNCLEYPEIVFACARLGVAAVLLNWRLPSRELVRLLEHNRAQGVILKLADPERERGLCDELGGRIPVFHLDGTSGGRSYEELLAGEPSSGPAACLTEDHILMHLHTSGTTGSPKPVLYSHGSFSKQVLAYLYHMEMTASAVCQQMTQMFHSACVAMFGCLAAGATVIALDRFHMEEYLSTIERERSTRLALIPSILRQIVAYPRLSDYDLSCVKEVAYSTAPMPPKLIQAAMKVLPCRYYTTYGMTEMGPIVTAMGAAEHRREELLSYVGKPIIGCDVKIVAKDGSICPPGTTGEIAVRGFGMMRGYLDMERETRAAIRDGWFYTGDLGCLSEDGYLRLRGRRNHMIITGGENVYPCEVQNALQAVCDEISEIAVYGVPDDRWGEAVVASVVLSPGADVDEEELRRRCRSRLAGYQIPKRIFIESDLPRNQVGKVLIKVLVDRYAQRMSEQ